MTTGACRHPRAGWRDRGGGWLQCLGLCLAAATTLLPLAAAAQNATCSFNTFSAPTGIEPESAIAIAKEAVAGALRDQTIVKEIYVPGRIVNFVIKP